MALGVVLALVGVGYLLYAEIARSRLDNLVYEVSQDDQTAWLTAHVPDHNSVDILPKEQTSIDDDIPVLTGLIGLRKLTNVVQPLPMQKPHKLDVFGDDRL